MDPPTPATLCTLPLGAATAEDVRATLGPESSAVRAGSLTQLFYHYGGAVLMLELDERDVVVDAVTEGLPYPACWRGYDRFGGAAGAAPRS